MSSDLTPLLTVHVFISTEIPQGKMGGMVSRLAESGMVVKLYRPDEGLNISPRAPRVYVSIGEKWEDFVTLNALPFYERKRWLHFRTPADVQPSQLFYCWLRSTDSLPEEKSVPASRFSSATPLVSVFTASYRSKEKIQRPYRSLLNQTYTNWEWVIVDDSGDKDATYNKDLLPLSDPRVRRYRQDSRNGYIGATKRYAAGLCTGEILVEMDHDDELTPDCLQKIVEAFQAHPDCGFVWGDCTEVYAENRHSHWYGWDCGYGYAMYYRVWVHEMNRWQNVLKNTVINANTIRHLVGLPNHPRAWTRDTYHLVGGHREELLVADDYDLLVRTFLCTKYVSIPDLLYIQYRNEQGDNSTFTRNSQIQTLVRELNAYYHERITAKLASLGLYDVLPYSRIWETASDDLSRKSAHIQHEKKNKLSALFPIPYSSPDTPHTQLLQALKVGSETGFKELEVVVVGRIPAEVEHYASQAPMGAVRWWPMEPSDSMESCIEYAKLISSCEQKIVKLP